MDASFADVGRGSDNLENPSVWSRAWQAKMHVGMSANARDIRVVADNMQENFVYMEDWLSFTMVSFACCSSKRVDI